MRPDDRNQQAYTIHVGRGVTTAKGCSPRCARKATDDFNGLSS